MLRLLLLTSPFRATSSTSCHSAEKWNEFLTAITAIPDFFADAISTGSPCTDPSHQHGDLGAARGAFPNRLQGEWSYGSLGVNDDATVGHLSHHRDGGSIDLAAILVIPRMVLN